MWIINARKKGSRVIQPIEINERIVPWIKIICGSQDSRIDLTPHKRDLMDYFNTPDLPGAAQVRMILKRYEKVNLVNV